MSDETKRRLRRAKDSERRLGRWLMEHDGPDPRFVPGGGIASSTGRVGHITGLQIDVLSKSYASENKMIRVWAGLWTFWKQIVERANAHGKNPLLRIEPTNPDMTVNGLRVPELHIITAERHAELLAYENSFKAARGTEVLTLQEGRMRPYSKAEQANKGRRKKVAR